MNSRNHYGKGFLILFLITQLGCAGAGKIDKVIDKPLKPEKNSSSGLHNFMFVGYDTGITDPTDDKRSFYKIFINKVEAGRTTIGLESQKKYFNTKLDINRHLIRIEKWSLDRKKGKYIKLNNIYQPKPDFIYINVDESKKLIIRMVSAKGDKADYNIKSE